MDLDRINKLKELKAKIEGWQQQGVTFARILAQMDKWKQQMRLSRDEMFELKKVLGV